MNFRLSFLALVGIMMLLIPQIVLGSVSEYLVKGEHSGDLLLSVEVDGDHYSVFEIKNSQDLPILVLGPDSNLPSDENLKKVLITYHSHLYYHTRTEDFEKTHRKTTNVLIDQGDSISQAILNAFKQMEELCVPIPKFEVISVCVKPTQELGITKMGGFWRDWNVALENYRNLWARMDYVKYQDSEPLKFEELEGFYEGLGEMHLFLKAANQETGLFPNEVNLLDPKKSLAIISGEASNHYGSIQTRKRHLIDVESALHQETESLLNEVRLLLREISTINGDYEDLNQERMNFNSKFSKLSVHDQRYSSDITSFANLKYDLGNLKTTVENRLNEEKAAHESKFFFARWWNSSVGFVKALFFS